MKHLVLSVITLFCTSYSAMAIYNPNWERPLFQSEAKEIDATGHEINPGLSKIITLNQRDGETAPTTISFEEESYNMCVMLYLPGQSCPLTRKDTKNFKIESATKDSCGAVTYVAREITTGLQTRSATVIRLLDHSNDICEYVIPAVWEVKIVSPFQVERLLQGNPHGVATAE